jgi:predicted phage-related endonuclease
MGRAVRVWGEDNTAAIPAHYLVQITHYQAVTGWLWNVAALIGGTDFRLYHIERDLEAEAGLNKAEELFWREYVLKRVPP